MSVKNAIKILDWWIKHKKQGMDELKTKWNYRDYDDAIGVTKIIIDMDKTILYNLEKIRSEIVPNCKHSKKMRDRAPDGQWYCMNCNLDL